MRNTSNSISQSRSSVLPICVCCQERQASYPMALTSPSEQPLQRPSIQARARAWASPCMWRGFLTFLTRSSWTVKHKLDVQWHIEMRDTILFLSPPRCSKENSSNGRTTLARFVQGSSSTFCAFSTEHRAHYNYLTTCFSTERRAHYKYLTTCFSSQCVLPSFRFSMRDHNTERQPKSHSFKAFLHRCNHMAERNGK